MRTIIEPFRIKAVEPLFVTTIEERESILRYAHFNVFNIRAKHVLIDLLTDSGTGAMIIPNNNHFDTTRANIEHSGAEAVDLVIDEAADPRSRHPFKGNLDVRKLEALIERVGADRIPLCMVTVTNNSGGGQPVSLENLRAVRAICDRYGIPLFLDACRFAENAYFIKLRENGQSDRPVRDIVRDMFDLADGATISAKKDGLVNIGGVLLLRDDALAQRADALLMLNEGFTTYGGLAGRDLEAMAQGFDEVVHEDYLAYRIRSTAYLARSCWRRDTGSSNRPADTRSTSMRVTAARTYRRGSFPARPSCARSTDTPEFARARLAASCSAVPAGRRPRSNSCGSRSRGESTRRATSTT
jgi:tryptophanase